MEVKYTNYDGNWDENCPYCGKKQKEHQVDAGVLDDIQYIHRQPCPEEQYQIRKRAVKQSIILRTILFFYDFAKYIWGLIPFKEEIKLVWQAIKHIFVSIRALFHLNRSKPK